VIVGIAGYAGAGKDTAASALTALGWRQDAFAAPLKAMALDINPWVGYLDQPCTLAHIVANWGWERAKTCEDVRRFLQRLGAAVRKHLGEDVWAEALWARHLRVEAEVWTVVSDVRYTNEARMILRPPICMWWRPTLLWVSRPGIGPANDHESEDGQVRHLCTHEIANDGTVEELHRKVREAVGV
jgi:hypothetical protein